MDLLGGNGQRPSAANVGTVIKLKTLTAKKL